MLRANRPIALVQLFSLFWLSGCPSSHSNFGSSRKSPSLAKLSVAPSSHVPSASKHPPRDSAFSVYNNPTYGVSFRYPRNYLLKEDLDADDSALLQRQQELEAQQPDAIPVATVLVLDDAYPNTTFSGGYLQFAVNPHATAETCRGFLAPPDPDWPGSLDETIVEGIPFHWRDRGSLAAESVSASRDYVGFSNGTCYEFFLQVTSTSSVGSAIPLAHTDLVRILRPLEKTVSSLQLHPAPALSSSK